MGYLQQMRYVILPQALQDRGAADRRLLGAGGEGHGAHLDHRLRRAVEGRHVVTNATFQPFTVYGLVALIYFALCWPLSKSSQLLERKLNVAHRNH